VRRVTAAGGFLEDLFSLTGCVALVTGGSSGIGAGMAAALAQAGAQVVLVARDAERLGSAVAGLRARGGQASAVSADLADRVEVERTADEAAASFGPPDILVNCAGINLRPPLGSLTVEDWDATMAVNLTAPFLLGQRFGPRMAERGWGRIINVTSQQAARAFGNSGGYGASKGGLAALTRGLAHEGGLHRIRAVYLSMGVVKDTKFAQDNAELLARMPGTTGPLGGLPGPADIAEAVAFLASDRAAYITGEVLNVAAGAYMRN
jgi:gluconate 5-dehydrogenase